MRRRHLLLVAALLALGGATPAFAHAELVSTSPGDGAVVRSAPTELRVRFDDPVTVGPGNAVVGAGRSSVLDGSPRVERGGHELVLPLRKLRTGDYSARWTIISDDGHLESGVLAFRVGNRELAAGAPRSMLEAGSGRPSGADVVGRWLFLAGILVAGGVALFRLLVSRAGARQAAALLVVALSAVVLGGLWLLHTTHAGATRFGHVTTAAVVLAAAGAFATLLLRTRPRLQVLGLGAPLALLAAPTLSGHAARAAGDRPLSVAADLLHVATAAFWIGGLLQLGVVLAIREDAGAARRFSRLALPAVLLLVISGLARAVVELDGVSQLWSTGYGQAILVKGALLAPLILLGWLNRHWLRSATRLLRNVSLELALLAVAVGAVAVLTELQPGRELSARPVAAAAAAPSGGSITFAQQSRELAVALAVRPGPSLGLVATVLGQSGRGVDGLDVRLGADRASTLGRACGHGCYAASLPASSPSVFEVDIAGAGRSRSITFPVAGAWPPRPGAAFLHRATRAFRRLRSVLFLEHLASGPGAAIETRWKLLAPDRIAYVIRGGGAGIVIGDTRWDRQVAGAKWRRSETATNEQPFPPWGTRMADVRVVNETKSRTTVSWFDARVPAWFTGTFDRRTTLPRTIRMTAPAHFMRQTYLAYNRGVEIEPPPTG